MKRRPDPIELLGAAILVLGALALLVVAILKAGGSL